MALSGKQQKFIDAYLGEANCNATEAARLSGYAGNDNTLSQIGFKLVRNGKIAEAISIHFKAGHMSADEVIERIAGISRNDDHKGQLKALELSSKYHGLLSDNIQIKIEGELTSLLDKLEVELAPEVFEHVLSVISRNSTKV